MGVSAAEPEGTHSGYARTLESRPCDRIDRNFDWRATQRDPRVEVTKMKLPRYFFVSHREYNFDEAGDA